MKHHPLISHLLALMLSWPIQAQVVPVHSVTSPEVSGLGEYGKVPVSLYTGIPNISVPLHEAKFGKYSLPISADYHLGSVRPNDPPGCLGLGWSLAADFSISRSVRGVCDETRSRGASVGNGYYWHTGDMHDVVDDPTLFAGITRDHLSGSSVDDDSWYELSADEFSFTLPGCSGNFYLNENGGWTVVCDRDVKVEFNPSTGFADCSDLTSRIPGIDRWEGRRYKDCFFIRFTLVADDGVRYTFGGVDATDFSIPYYSRSKGEIVATAWHLKRIETPEGYSVTYDYLSSVNEESIMVDLRYSPGGSSLEAPLGFSSPDYLYSNSQGRSAFTGFLLYSVNLRSITTPNERISFEYHPDIHYGDIYAHESGEALYWDRSGSDGLYRTDRYSMVQEDPAGQFRKLFPEISGSTPSEVRESIAGHLRSYFLYRISIDNIRGGRDMSIFFSYCYGNRRQEGRAVCHLYDIHGRECVRLSVRRTLSDGQMCEGIPFVRHVGANGQFGGYGFEGDILLLEDAQILSLSYYDSYGFMDGPATGLPSDTAQDGSVNPAPTGLQTGSWTALIEEGHVTGEGVWTGMWYDRRGRMIHSRSAWPQGGLQTEDVAYDFLGSPVEKHLTQRHHSGADTVSEDLLYTYDNQERLLTVSHSLNGAPYVQLQSNTYDALGRLSATSHGTSASLTEQRSYNVRSQPTSISSGLFTEHLYYNAARAASSVPRYNGNISSMTWKASGDSWMRIYDFGYDGLDRLTAARYLNENIALCCDNYSAEFAYDIQGNVTSVSRRSMSGRNSVLLDNLQLTYDGNRLVSVEDSATSSQGKAMGFRDMAHEECEYGYDANGNTVRDLNRGVGSVCYDVTDHPSLIQADSVRVGYGYLASGIKTRVSVSSPRDSIVTEYRGNHVWKNGRLSYILFDGGYMDCEASGTPYVFYLRDHLGNNRVAALSTGEVLQVNNYYPFGLNFATNEQSSTRQPGRPILMSDDPFDDTIDGAIDIPLDPGEDILLVMPREDQPWRFGGKELLSATSLDLYDFEARLYDPALGRFLQPDPMAEKYYDVSPYCYCADNPVAYVDPSGEEKILRIPVKQSTLRLSAISFPDDKAIHIFAHGLPKYINVIGDKISNGKELDEFLAKNSKTWSSSEEKSDIVIVLHTCFSASGDESVAKEISKSPVMKGVIIVGASDEVHVNKDYTESVSTDSENPNSEGVWLVFMNGQIIDSLAGNEIPTYDRVTEKKESSKKP